MADPLSMTASAAGLVSLGIQVVGGIMKYLDAVHERKDDVASAKQQVTHTHELLQCVTKVAAKIEQNHNTTATFLKDASSIQKELQALDEIVQSLSTANASPQNQKVLGKVYVQAKKLTYPFHRPTMDRLQSRLTRVNEMLQAALQVSILDITIDIEGDTSAIKTTLRDSTLSRQIAEQLKHETVANRDALTRVGDSVASFSSSLDHSLTKGFEDITISTTRSLSVLNKDRADNQVELLHELSLARGSISGLSDVVKGVDVGVIKIQEDVATNSHKIMSVLRKDYADTQAQMFQELATTRSGISDLSDHLEQIGLALGALPTREELGRLISKPGELKGLCEALEKTTEATSSRHFGHRPRTDLFRLTSSCVCRKRVIRSRKALMLGPWQASADISAIHDHSTDCPCHFPDVSDTSKRWAVAFRGLQGLINRAIELSFTCSFGAGGYSLSPGFTYYPSVDRRRDPAFRIMGLFGWACTELDEREPGFEGFLEQCMKNMALLYRNGRAAPRAVDQYGRGVLHYLDKFSTLYMDQNTLLRGIDTLLKHGVQATMYDTYGSTPAWNITCLSVWPGAWDTDGENRFYGPDPPLNWDSGSLLTEFLCATDPCVTIVNERLLEHSTTSDTSTIRLFSMMQRSSATAEALGCGPLGLAAFEGDSRKIELILAKYPKATSERNLLNQTPLHLAVGHASCVALLLRGAGGSLINVPDSGGRRPVEYALFSCPWRTGTGDSRYRDGCSKCHGDTSLNILLDEGCMMPKQTLWRSAFVKDTSLCNNCLLVFSKHLVRQRESLKMLAKSHLPEALAVEMGVSSPYLLDSNACRVVHNLTDRGVHVPLSLQMHAPGESCDESTSVYHSYGPLPFSVLWELGFRDLDQPDKNGLTPLMFWSTQGWSSLARCSWLIEKGANFRRFVPHGPSTVSHQIYAEIGKFPRPFADDDPNLRGHVFYLTKRLSGQRLNPCVHCRCACSHGGCTPFVQFLHAALKSRHINSASEIIKKLPGIIMETHTSVEKAEIRSAIRYATFEMLGIRHTCCREGLHVNLTQPPICHEEAEELRQEDSFLIKILDDLVTEFEKELPPQQMCPEDFQKESMSFWPNYWLPRVQEVLESLNSAGIEESDKVAAEDVGVVWQKQESGKGRDCDGDFDGTSSDGFYHESDWDSEVDVGEMFDTFRTMGDWNSRLDLIMSKAGLPKPQA